MFRKLLTSFNCIVGTVAIVFALFSGLLPWTGGGVEAHKVAMARIVESIAKIEGGKRDIGGYVTFPRNRAELKNSLQFSVSTNDYIFEAFFEDNKAGDRDFVIRATTSDKAVMDGRPPLIYRYIVPGNGSSVRKEWVKLSQKKYGLGLF